MLEYPVLGQGNRQKLGDAAIAFMSNKFNLFKTVNQIADLEMELLKKHVVNVEI